MQADFNTAGTGLPQGLLVLLVIPAKAGIQGPLHKAACRTGRMGRWIPAFAGMTVTVKLVG